MSAPDDFETVVEKNPERVLRAAVSIYDPGLRTRGGVDLANAATRLECNRERDAAVAVVERVRALAEGWLTEPCVGGYRIPNGNDDDSQCLHCAADDILRALDGGDRS